MTLATSANVASALGRTLTATETSNVANMIEQASDLVVGYLGHYPDPAPAPIARAVATMVAAVFDKPTVTTADYDASGYSTSREYARVAVGVESQSASGPWLTKGLKQRLAPFRQAGRAVPLVSEQRGGLQR